jgi:hypothetical protein
VYTVGTMDGKNFHRSSEDHEITLQEKQTGGNDDSVICSTPCKEKNQLEDNIHVSAPGKTATIQQQFSIDGKPAEVYRMDDKGNIQVAEKQELRVTATKIDVVPIP